MNNIMKNILSTLNILIKNEKDAATYNEMFNECKASVSSLDIKSSGDMLMPLFKAALLSDIYQLAHIEEIGVWSNEDLNSIIDSVTDTIYNYARKGTFNDIEFEKKRFIYQEIFGWDISLLGFPRRR